MKKQHQSKKEHTQDPTLTSVPSAERHIESEGLAMPQEPPITKNRTSTGEHHALRATGTDDQNILPLEIGDEYNARYADEPEDSLPDHQDRNK